MSKHTTDKKRTQACVSTHSTKSDKTPSDIVIRPKKGFKPPKGSKGKVIVQGRRFAVFKWSEKRPYMAIRKLNKDQYLVIRTNEIREYKQSEYKDNLKSLRKTFDNLRGLIRTNFTQEAMNQVHITLTFDRAIRDGSVLYDLFEQFMKRLKRHYYWHKFENIVIMEPHETGVWHCHLLLKTTSSDSLYIKQDVLTKIWRNGRVWINQIKSSDVGSYYVAYFTDIICTGTSDKLQEVDQIGDSDGVGRVEENGTGSIVESDGVGFDLEKDKLNDDIVARMSPEERKKNRVKGGRLKYYPKNFKFYRCSRGIDRTITVPDVDQAQMTKLGYGKPTGSSSVELVKVEDEKNEISLNTYYTGTYCRRKELPPKMSNEEIVKWFQVARTVRRM